MNTRVLKREYRVLKRECRVLKFEYRVLKPEYRDLKPIMLNRNKRSKTTFKIEKHGKDIFMIFNHSGQF